MDDFSGQKVLHYRIIEKLGEGDSGQVFGAWDTALGRMVALKVLRRRWTEIDSFRDRCLPTLKTLTHCVHPCICRVYGVHEVDASYILVTEYVEGITLKELVSHGPVGNSRFLDIAAQVAEGLGYAHNQLIMHGNIKPSNIMITDLGHAKIMDFGLSCYAVGKESGEVISSPESLYYLSPEQVKGEPVSPVSDLFSLGALFYRLLTGRPPFTGDTREAIESSILQSRPDFQVMSAGKIRGDIILLIEKLLAENPSDRFGSAGELMISLRAIHSFERKSKTRKFPEIKPERSRQYLLISLLVALLVVLWYVLTTYAR